MSRISKNVCFDKDLFQREDIDFFLISSKDNIILNIENKQYCHKRKDLVGNYYEFFYYNTKYYMLSTGILLDEKSFNLLKYRNYSLYKLEKTDKQFKRYGFVYKVIPYKSKEYFY